MPPDITAEKALIFRITHIKNVPWILANGLHCCNSECRDPNFCEIGNQDLIKKRTPRPVPIKRGGVLSDYIPFYFTPHSPMLLNIKTGYNGLKITPMPDIAILFTSLPKLREEGVSFVFTDRHAYLIAAQFFRDPADLDRIDWSILQKRDFKRDPENPEKFEKYQAEALIHQHLPVSALLGIVCHGPTEEKKISKEVARLSLTMKVKRNQTGISND